MRYGACVGFSGELAAERKLNTHRLSEASVCLERWTRLMPYVGTRKRDTCLSHEGLILGIASSRETSFLFSMRTESKLYFGPNRLQRKTTGGIYPKVSPRRFRPHCHKKTPLISIICHLQQFLYYKCLNKPRILDYLVLPVSCLFNANFCQRVEMKHLFKTSIWWCLPSKQTWVSLLGLPGEGENHSLV